jgi:hypothetical protein
VHASTVQIVQGTAQLSSEAKELLDLINQFGGTEAAGLQSAVHELEDQAARTPDRLRSRQMLKGFLHRISGSVGTAALAVLQKYVEAKLNLK